MGLMIAILISALSGQWHTLTDADIVYRIIPETSSLPSETLILATSGGVIYFDTQSKAATAIYTNTEGLLGTIVTDVERDANGYVWALAKGRGLSFKNGSGEFTPYPPSAFPPSVGALDLEPLPDGRMLIATSAGLFILDTRGTYDDFDDDMEIEISMRRGFPFDSDTIVSVDFYNDTVYVATPFSVYLAPVNELTSFGAWHEFPLNGTGIENHNLTKVCRYEDYFVVGSENGFYVVIGDTAFSFFTGSEHNARLADCFEGQDGALYVALYRYSWSHTDGGVWRITPSGTAEGLGLLSGSAEGYNWGRFATSIFDNGGQLVAGFGHGTNPFSTKYGAGIAFYDSLDDVWVNHHIGVLWFNSPAFVLPHGDVMWLLMRDGATYPVYIQGVAEDTVYVQQPPFRLKGVFAYAVDHRGFVWAGTYSNNLPDTMQGILVFDSTARFIGRIGATSAPIIDMAFSAGDTLYMCLARNGTFKLSVQFEGDSIASYDFSQVDFEVTDPVDIDIDGKNRLWIGTQGMGVKVIDLKDGESFWITEGYGLPSNYINMFKADGNGMWVCTKEGLVFFDDDMAPHLYLQGEDVSAVAPSGDGRLWVVTSDRVLVLRPEYNYIEDQFTPGAYGMPEAPNPAYKTEVIAVRENIGDVWIATSNGVGVFRPDAMRTYNQLERPYIFPNPYRSVDGVAYVTVVDVAPNADVAVFDITGKREDVELRKRGTEVFIKAKDLAPGLYVVVVKSGSSVKRLKLAVK